MKAAGSDKGAHILTVNLEDYFQLTPLSGYIPQRYWPRFESRIERNTHRTLELLDQIGHKATFFANGWIAEQVPGVIAEVSRRGHEIASKGYHHRPLKEMSQEEFRDDVRRSKDVLERASGQRVLGFRIAREAVASNHPWFFDVLSEEGYTYDSSVRPLGFGQLSGSEQYELHRKTTNSGVLWEVPFSSVRLLGVSIPVAGGNFIRQFPDRFMRRQVDQLVRRSDAPLVFYFHVWELDDDLPLISAASGLAKLRLYRNLRVMPERIRYYLERYSFHRVADALGLTLTPVEARDCVAPGFAEITVSNAVRRPVTVVVPCYNEEQTLNFLKNVLAGFEQRNGDQFGLSYVFVDDGSTDRTFEILTRLFGERPDCQLVRHEKNAGVAAATLTGLRHAKDETVGVIDCDCSYDPEHLVRMVAMLDNGVDLVTASPYHREGKVLNVPAWRLMLSRGLSLLYKQVLDTKLATYTACFRVYRRSSVVGLSIDDGGFLGITEILVRLDQSGARIVECPAILETRLLGHSKMRVVKTIWKHIGILSRLVRDRVRGSHQLRQDQIESSGE